MNAKTLDQTFDEWLGDISEADSLTGEIYPFGVRVGCVKMSAPRHERFEFMLNMGYADIDRVFNKRSFGKDVLTFVFPERHMGVHEQHSFMARLNDHPEADSIKRVDIITSSAVMISSFHREMIRILTWDDDPKHSGK